MAMVVLASVKFFRRSQLPANNGNAMAASRRKVDFCTVQDGSAVDGGFAGPKLCDDFRNILPISVPFVEKNGIV